MTSREESDESSLDPKQAFEDLLKQLPEQLNGSNMEDVRQDLKKLIGAVVVHPSSAGEKYDIEIRGPLSAINLVAEGRYHRIHCRAEHLYQLNWAG